MSRYRSPQIHGQLIARGGHAEIEALGEQVRGIPGFDGLNSSFRDTVQATGGHVGHDIHHTVDRVTHMHLLLVELLNFLTKTLSTVFSCDWSMSHFVTAAILHQQVPTDQIRQTRTVLEAIMSDNRSTWSKFGVREELADLFKRWPYCRAMLMRWATTS